MPNGIYKMWMRGKQEVAAKEKKRRRVVQQADDMAFRQVAIGRAFLTGKTRVRVPPLLEDLTPSGLSNGSPNRCRRYSRKASDDVARNVRDNDRAGFFSSHKSGGIPKGSLRPLFFGIM